MSKNYEAPPVPGLNRVRANTDQSRLCRRPERKPGVAPECEDDNIQTPGYYTTHEYRRTKVTLPEVQWLKRGAA